MLYTAIIKKLDTQFSVKLRRENELNKEGGFWSMKAVNSHWDKQLPSLGYTRELRTSVNVNFISFIFSQLYQDGHRGNYISFSPGLFF